MLDDTHRHPSTTPSHAGTVTDGPSDFTVRSVSSSAECRACVALQQEIWGDDDAVPASVLQVVSKVGGIVAGAFAADGELVGFVFGLPALMNGTVAHWSHVLGVRDSARNAGVGRMLKEFQRAELARRGIDRMYWTYDPLVAKNAHLNLNLLGARVVEYVRDMYGTTTSPLHHGLATDRLVVVCETVPHRYRRADASARTLAGRPLLTPEPRDGDVIASLEDGEARPQSLLVEVPADFQLLAAQAIDRASEWRAATRRHFEWALQHGYAVQALHRDPVTSRSFYVFELQPKEGSA